MSTTAMGQVSGLRSKDLTDIAAWTKWLPGLERGRYVINVPNTNFTIAGTLDELKAKGRLVLHGAHRPILVVYDRGRVFALDNRCPHMGFPLDRGSIEDGILLVAGTTPALTSKAAALSICGRTTRRPSRSRCATTRSG